MVTLVTTREISRSIAKRTRLLLFVCHLIHQHILQPLDVGCFGPLKKAYGREIEKMIRTHITHITKTDFLPAFYTAFQTTMNQTNIQGDFRGSGLVPCDPELDIKLRTPTPPLDQNLPWTSKTPSNPIEATSQTEYVKKRIASHQDSSPTSSHKGTQGVFLMNVV
jgi:hypothetical protein